MPVFQKRQHIQFLELPVSDGKDGCVELVCGQFVGDFDAVFMPYYFRIGPRVVNRDMDIVLLQCPVDVYDLGVAHIRAVLLESESEDEDVGVKYLKAFLEHQLYCLGGDVLAHTVVHAAACEDDLGVVAVPLGALCQIVGVYTYAVTTHQTGLERQEVPFRGGCLQYVLSVDAELTEYL